MDDGRQDTASTPGVEAMKEQGDVGAHDGIFSYSRLQGQSI